MPRATKDVKKDELESKKKVGKSTTTAKKATTKSTKNMNFLLKKKRLSEISHFRTAPFYLNFFLKY